MESQSENPRKWEILESEYIIRRPWLTARRDKVRLPNGTIHPEYYVLEYPIWVNVIAVTPRGEYIMVEQYRHGLGITETELCAGVAEPGETPLQAIRRELAEETGYTSDDWTEIMVTSANPGSLNNLCHCFLARNAVKTQTPHLDPTEDLTIRLISLAQLQDLVLSDSLKQSLMAAPILKYLYSLRPELRAGSPISVKSGVMGCD